MKVRPSENYYFTLFPIEGLPDEIVMRRIEVYPQASKDLFPQLGQLIPVLKKQWECPVVQEKLEKEIPQLSLLIPPYANITLEMDVKEIDGLTVKIMPQENLTTIRIKEGSLNELKTVAHILQEFINLHLDKNHGLWGRHGLRYLKEPVELFDNAELYSGFVWKVHPLEGKLFLALDTIYREVDSRWLTEYGDVKKLREFEGRRGVYYYGLSRFEIKILEIPGTPLCEVTFLDPETQKPTNLYSYLQERERNVLRVRNLKPDDPALVYTYPRLIQKRRWFAPAALVRLILKTENSSEAHKLTQLMPEGKIKTAAKFVKDFFQHISFLNNHINCSPSPWQEACPVFKLPEIKFGSNYVLRPKGNIVKDFPAERWKALLDFGTACQRHLSEQCFVLPTTLREEVADALVNESENFLHQILKRKIKILPIWYTDPESTAINKSLDAIKQCLIRNRKTSSYCLIVLPKIHHPQFHDVLKDQLWNCPPFDCRFQCARYDELLKHFPFKEGTHRSYLRELILGLLLVNEYPLYTLNSPFHYDAYVAVDVLNSVAGSCLIAEGGRILRLHLERFRPGKKIPKKLIKRLILKVIRGSSINQPLNSLIILRDGQLQPPEESEGIIEAVQELKEGKMLVSESMWGIVEVLKRIYGFPVRVVQNSGGSLKAPPAGLYRRWGREAILITTGWPFEVPGTPRSLHLRYFDGNANFERILQDLFSQSLLNWAAPMKPQRLPLPLHVLDDALRPWGVEVEPEVYW